ncbi:MAG: T9SS type A sorting domain-containing protein [Paludibacter sp.]|nr:T9SS type A sorting domain-containing protein [Paludibacter sp.]
MKTKLLIVLSLMFYLYSFGQEAYKSFIHSGVTKWLYFSPQDGCLMDEIDAYGDTIINQLTYKKLWTINFVPQPPYVNVNQQWRDYTQFTGLTNSFIRQSSDSSRLYLLDGTNNVEYLIADMNLKVGDEFIFSKFGSDIVENIVYKDGLKNIQFGLNATWDKLTFIESVGHNIHILSAMKNFSFPPNVLICYSNSSYFYSIFSNCGCVDSKIEDVNTDKYKIKQLSGLIEISFDESAIRTWELFDIYGRTMQKSEIINQQSIQIPISGFKSGIYLLRIYNLDNKESKLLKIILKTIRK